MAKLTSYQDISIKNSEEALALLGSGTSGLTRDEVSRRKTEYGANELKDDQIHWYEILFRQFKSAFIYLLVGASVVALYQREYIDAGLIFLFLVLNAVLGYFQEYRAEKALSLLKTFVDRKTRVRREGVEVQISVTEVVPGDVVLLDAGDMLPGDGYFIRADGVTVDESPLTGETEPVVKNVGVLTEKLTSYYGATNLAFTRTTLLSGDGEVLIFATGAQTVIGDIARHMKADESLSGFEIGINQFSTFILKMVIATIPLIFLLNWFVHYDAFSFSKFLLFSIALTVSVIPEALPLVMTLSLSRGAIALARKQVVPRRLSAIEDLGSIDVLCTDKTGTITENALAVSAVYGDQQEVIRHALYIPLSAPNTTSAQNSVFDIAFMKYSTEEDRSACIGLERIDELPFDPLRRRDSILVRVGGRMLLIMRGSPEKVWAVAKEGMSDEAREWAEREGKKGCRVLAIAYKDFGSDVHSLSEADETGMHVLGMIALSDPLKDSTVAAVAKARELGVQVKVITGDAREVAGWVGFSSGILSDPNDVITGDELDRLTAEEKLAAVDRYHVFARTMPLQKNEIIALLQKSHLVGFLGEGFNDAPALKAAHVGLAVSNASDIAQDAADVVLLNPSLMVIIDGVHEGRKIFANSMKYLRVTLASNFGNFYALALSSLFIPYLPMLPIQILLLNLLSDFPMMTIATDNVDDKELEKPRGYKVSELTSIAIVLGIVSTIFDFAFFGYFQQFGESVLQTMWLTGSILTELVAIYTIRTTLPFWRARRPALGMVLLTCSTALITILLPFIPIGREFFHLIRPEASYVVAALALVLGYFVTTEITKIFFYHLWKSKESKEAGMATS